MRNINELIGIINGISYDGIINKLEVARLSSWVKKNRNLSYEHKQAHLISLVEQVLEDGIITDEEREMLLENCSQYTAFETDSIAKVYELTVELLLCSNISKKRKKNLRKLMIYFGEVDFIDLHTVNWNVQYNRNNQTSI